MPAIPGAEHGITSDGFFELADRPQRVAVVGSGYIAVELAGVFAALGSEVTMVLRRDRVLRSFEAMLGTGLRKIMEDDGVAFLEHAVPQALERARLAVPAAAVAGSEGAVVVPVPPVAREEEHDELDGVLAAFFL